MNKKTFTFFSSLQILWILGISIIACSQSPSSSSVTSSESSQTSTSSIHEHTHVTHVERLEPTTSLPGNIEFWACLDCFVCSYNENFESIIPNAIYNPNKPIEEGDGRYLPPIDKGASYFSQSFYKYDKFGGRNLELPLKLAEGASVVYLLINDKYISNDVFYYDTTKNALNIIEDTIIHLPLGLYKIQAITTSTKDTNLSCEVSIFQSFKTEWNDTQKQIANVGYEDTLSFLVDTHGIGVRKILIDGKVLDSSFYSCDDSHIFMNEDIFKFFPISCNVEFILNNNDVYYTTVYNNVIFATDYDFHTEHDTTISTTGQNRLYQYSTNVEIVESPIVDRNMKGRVLRITPNTVPVLYDCNNYYDLQSLTCGDACWTTINYNESPDEVYAISFDYLTKDTSTGSFYYGSLNAGTSFYDKLILGDDNVVHHYNAIVNGKEMGGRISLYAFFKDAGGKVYVDNFRIVRLNEKPTFSLSSKNYVSGDFKINFDPKGLVYEFKINNNEIQYTYDSSTKQIVVKEADIAKIKDFICKVSITSSVCTFEDTFYIDGNDPYTAVLYETTKDVKTASVKLSGEFSSELSVVKLEKKASHPNDVAYAKQSIETNLVSLESDGLTITSALVASCYQTTHFYMTLSNGRVMEFSLNSNSVFFEDFNDTFVNYSFGEGNASYCQDTGMFSYQTKDNRRHLKYQPEKASLQHSIDALNGILWDGMAANGVFTYRNKDTYKGSTHHWEELSLGTTGQIKIVLEYQIFAEGKSPRYSLGYQGIDNVWNLTHLINDGRSHKFTLRVDANKLVGLAVNCPATNINEVMGTWLEIYSFRISIE